MIDKTVPNVTFHYRVRDESVGGDNPFVWKDVTTDDLFKGKKVLIFSLPGAFTPTCSTMQVPRFEQMYDQLVEELGLDQIYVVSVNDTFVMRKWMIDQGVTKLDFIPDGSGKFTEAMGMLVDKDNLGFGKRSWRYAALIDDLNVTAWFEEPGREDNCESDPYGETSPDFILEQLTGVSYGN